MCRPIKRSVILQVFLRIPECAVVNRVDGHAAVISPTVETSCLGATSGKDEARFGLHGAQWIRDRPARVADSWMYATTGIAIANQHVSDFVHCYASHPAEVRVRCKGAL